MNPEQINSLNSLRILSIDMINCAKSGHPGICLGAAPMMYSLYSNFLRANPKDPKWPNRDRFVLSAGHGSALLYATLFMAGYDLTIDDLVNFRRINSKTPGHPELGMTPGVEVSTGVLGQGFATAVGMAISEKYLQALLDTELPKQKLINYKIYCLVSDGDLQEGTALEAASIAGYLGLDNLIVLYDSNDITLDGSIKRSSTEDIVKKFIDMGWEVDYLTEGNDCKEIDKALERAQVNKKPTLIEIKTVIGRGSLKEGQNIVHGSPLTKEDIEHLRKVYKVNTNPMEISESAVKVLRDSINKRVQYDYELWKKNFIEAKKTTKESLKALLNFIETKDIGIQFSSANFKIQNDYMEELRESSSKIMNMISERTKFFIGGSADLSSSCHTALYKELDFSKRYPTGRNINFGVRESAMGAIANGIALNGTRAFTSTFLAFADFLKPSIRLACLMDLPVTYIFTHDSIAIGQDGPTHQPIEQLAMLRTTPNLVVLRPADINEVIGSWDFIINNKRPVALVLSKNEAHILNGTSGENVKLGGYIVKKEKERLDCIIISTGIDFTTAYLISEELRAKGIDSRMVSMPSVELFLEQPEEYQNQVLPPNVKTFTIEASSTLPWYRFASRGCAIGVDDFGYSGLKNDVLEKMEFDYETIISKIEKQLNINK